MAEPKWVTPERQDYLVKLFLSCGNKCLLGHTVCPIANHYLYTEAKGVRVAIPVKLPCHDTEGNPIRNKAGDILYLTTYGSKLVSVKEYKLSRLYELVSERVISSWKQEDRLQREADWLAERKRIHSLGERRYPLRGQFSAISQEIYHDSQPLFYLVGMGVSGLTFRAFAQVRLSNSYVNLYVDLSDTLGKVSKSKRRKAVRYGKPLPLELQGEINKVCKLALDDYLTK
ncbi:hypothetical protein ES705_31710 [subsurface metagenome]